MIPKNGVSIKFPINHSQNPFLSEERIFANSNDSPRYINGTQNKSPELNKTTGWIGRHPLPANKIMANNVNISV